MSLFWSKKNLALVEEYRLIASAEKARENLVRIAEWRMYQSKGEALQSQIPGLLAEVRYRYFLKQARKRGMVNRWIGEKLQLQDLRSRRRWVL